MLKEKAKWSDDLEEKKAAIKKLSTLGEDAISGLQEIMSITGYGDIKNACAEAIKSMRATSSSTTNGNSNSNNNGSQSNTGINTPLESALEYHVKGDYKKADIFFERALEIEPNHIETLNGRGTLLLYRLADYDKARNCFEKVLQVDPKNIVALNSIEILNKKKDDSNQQQKERPAPSVDTTNQQQKERPAPSGDSRTSARADPRNPYNDPTLPYYNPDLDKKNN